MTTRIVLIGGFLGSGKTTLVLEAVRRLVARGYRGNQDEYYDARNSYLDQVIDRAISHDTDFHQFMLYTPVSGTPLHKEHRENGTLLPETGDLAFLGPPEIAGADLAVRDINEAGGVLGADVVLEQGDSGDTTTDTANLEVDRLLAAGSDVVVGAASSAVSKTVIDKITGACTIQFSPANTSPAPYSALTISNSTGV